MPQPAGRLNVRETWKNDVTFKFKIFHLRAFIFPELQESYEQHFPPAEDDGDPTHEQRMPGHPASPGAGDSTGDKQRWVRVNTQTCIWRLDSNL